MNLSKSIFKPLFVFSLMAACSAFIYGQQFEPSYNVTLHLIIGSNDGATRTEIPAELGGISKEIRGTFPFSNHRLASTLLGRISNTGNYSYKSSSNIFGAESNALTQSFIEWGLNGFRSTPNAKGQNGFQVQGLRFGARVPVLMNVPGGPEKTAPVYSYEAIGLDLNKVSLPENTPTLIGTLNLPGAGGMIFLIMTVKSAD